MKRTLALLLALALSATPILAAGSVAYPSTQQVDVDGTAVEFQMYALKDENGNDTNYVKVRDVAHVLNGTAARFSVGWDGAAVNLVPGQSYEANGSEMSTPFSGERAYTAATAPTNVNGQAAQLDAIVLNDDNGGGYTYYKLRDLGAALGFTVDWSAEKGVFIQTAAQPPVAEAAYPVTLYALDGRTVEVPSDQAEAYLAVGWYYTPVTVLYAADGRTQVVPTGEVDAYVAVGWYKSLNDIKVTLYAADGRTIAVMPNEVDAYLSAGWYRSSGEASAHAVPFNTSDLKLRSVSAHFSKYSSSPQMSLEFDKAGNVPIVLDKTLVFGGYTFTYALDTDFTTMSENKNYVLPYAHHGKIQDADYVCDYGSGYIYFTANGVKYKLSFTKKGSDSKDISYSITKLG